MTDPYGYATVGVDPGASGALAIIDYARGWLLDVVDMPYVTERVGKRNVRMVVPETIEAWLSVRCEEHGPLVAAVERVGSMPGQGVTSTFNFGASYGKVLGVLAGLRIPTTVYRPAVWKEMMGLSSNKGESLALARRLWPDRANWFLRAKDDGRAEAALIAWFHRALRLGGPTGLDLHLRQSR